MESTILLYLKGNTQSRHELEQFLTTSSSENFWDIILIELENCVKWHDPDSVQCLLILISRRLLSHQESADYIPSSSIPILVERLLTIRHLIYPHSIIESLSTLLALVTLQSLEKMEEIIRYIDDTLLTENSLLLLIKYYTELAIKSSYYQQQNNDNNCSNILKNYFPKLLNCLCDILNTNKSTPSSGNGTNDQLISSSITCLRMWINHQLISYLDLLNTNPFYLIQTLVFYTRPDQAYSSTLLALADFYDDILTALSESNNGNTIPSGRTISIQTGDHTAITNGLDEISSLETTPTTAAVAVSLSPMNHECLIQSLAQYSEIFQSLLTEGYAHGPHTSTERVTYEHSYIRILAAAIKLLYHFTGNPFLFKDEFNNRNCTDYGILNVLQQLSLACSHRNLSYAVIAMEAINYASPRMSVECRKFLIENGIFRVVSEGCLYHYTHPPEDSDLDVDMDTWLMYREQTLSDCFRICYLELRSSLLQDIFITIEREVNAPNERSIKMVSGYLYSLKAIAMDITTRAQLNTSNNNSLFNVSRAGRGMETPEIIQQDSRSTSEFLINVLKGILGGGSSNTLMSQEMIILSSIQLIGTLSTWLSKGRYPSQGNYSSDSLVDVFTLLGADCIGYILQGLGNPLFFYYSALSLRSLCSKCGKLIAQSSDLMNSLIQSWSGLCLSNQSLIREQLKEAVEACGRCGDTEILSYVDEKVDILLEVEKSIIQGICMTIKHISSPEICRNYTEMLIQPPMSILISSCTSSSTDTTGITEIDLTAMITVITIFVRSIRIISQKEKSETTGMHELVDPYASSLNIPIDKSLHPALEILLVHDGSLFKSLLLRYPSSALSEAISYFFLSIVTFISPLLPISQLSTLVLFFSEHLGELFPLSLLGTCDLLQEIFHVIGSVIHYQKSKELLQSTHSEYSSPSTSSYSNEMIFKNLEDVLITLLTMTVEYLFTSRQYYQQLFPHPTSTNTGSTSPTSSMGDVFLEFNIFTFQWYQTRHVLLNTMNIEHFDSYLSFLQGIFDHIPSIAPYIPSLHEAVILSVLFISKECQNSSISLSACHFLKSIMSCGRRSIELRKTVSLNTMTSAAAGGGGEGTESTSIEYSPWEIYIATIISKYRDGIILECLCELLSDEMTSHEALVEGQIALLYSCLTDSLEASIEFPINECCEQLIQLLNIRKIASPLQPDIYRLFSYLLKLSHHQLSREYDFMPKEFLDYCQLISNISMKKETLAAYMELMENPN